ncbi:MAG: CPBP family glutamic-type intramembrane protease [Candidatus Bathyarchaeia archaeon]|jgi:membrane protease YdiL (CAAX protease family)
MPDSKSARANAEAVGRVLAIVIVVFSAVSYIVSLAIGPVLFFSTSDGLQAAARAIHEIPVIFFMALPIAIPVRANFGVLFIGIWVAFLICIALAWFSRGGFLKTVKGEITKSVPFARTNFLFVMPLVGSALLYATILISQFQETQGVQTGSLNFPPQTSPYVILVNLAFAPLQEEFAFRITSIGIPLGVYLLYRYRSDQRVSKALPRLKLLILAMFSPELAKMRLGYRNVHENGFIQGISPLEWILILITSFVFGAAHYLLGGGWDVGKVSTAFLAGLVFAVMYVAYGAYADILLHWFFNYFFTVLDMASSTYGGVFRAFATITELVNLTAGPVILVAFLLLSAWRLGRYLTFRATG